MVHEMNELANRKSGALCDLMVSTSRRVTLAYANNVCMWPVFLWRRCLCNPGHPNVRRRVTLNLLWLAALVHSVRVLKQIVCYNLLRAATMAGVL